ncbi:SusC/RagA family TonB-linked outer membrane protein [Abyssalbus ytuae]|uniref:TonB-dependent receptor n=1 Tax=Abyssalbus ytuae TaxID=2926907 RepID=A0A9E7CYM5_9FLAO|nr:TonB-dependent receptor [Abyssalbus ytuae]UOB16795.1 TonB-dependent receptor [Abyssalbus ytuae]
MRLKFFTLLMFIVPLLGFSQQTINVSGQVTDAINGTPLPGVNIIIKGTNLGASTDFDGNFTLENVRIGTTLVVSYIGFKTEEITINDSNPLQIALEEDLQSLDEVVVIGYGTQRKELVSGAFTSLNSEKITETNPARIEEALQGSVAGVQVNANSGSPGSSLNIRIRGITTNGDNSPLVIINGVNMGGDLSVIDPNDIEKIDIIKDASSAIYGVQAANGVILVTTKSGKKGSPTKFSYNSYVSFQEASNQLELMNATEYAAYVNETEAADGNPIPYTNLQNLGKGTDWQDELFNTAPIFSHNLNVNGGSDKVTYGISGSYFGQEGIIESDKSNFYRWTLKNDLGIDLTDNLKLNTFILYTNVKRKTIPESGRGSALYYALNASPLTPVYDDSIDPAISNGFSFIGTEQGNEIINPLALIHNTYNETKTNRFTGKIELAYDVIEDLKATTRFNFNYADVRYRSYSPLQYYGQNKVVNNVSLDTNGNFNLDTNDNGDRDLYSIVNENVENYIDYTWEGFIDYKKSFGDHNFNALLGASIRSEEYKGNFASGYLVTGPDTWDNAYLRNTQSNIYDEFVTTEFVRDSNGNLLDDDGNIVDPNDPDSEPALKITDNTINKKLDPTSSINEDRWYSLFGRIQYDYKGKYLLSAMLRRDASSRFGPNDRIGYFPSFSAGWVVTDEDFVNIEPINRLKLRGSWGITGNDKIGSYRWLGFLQGANAEAAYPFNDILTYGNAVGPLANPNLKWETNKQTNLGLDMDLLNNELSLTFDYYIKKTEDLLLVPETSALVGSGAGGSSAPVINAGTIENKGIDVAINYNHNFSDDFRIGVGYNLTTIKNKALEVNNAAGFISGGLFGLNQQTSRFQTGLPIGVFYGLKTDGIYQNQAEIDALNTVDSNNDGIPEKYQEGAQPGDIKYMDLDGDGVVEFGSNDDKTVIGNPIPDVTMGFNLNIGYKDFDFSTSLYASIGNDIVRSYERFLTYSNKSILYLDRWTGEGTSNSVPRASTDASNNFLFSDFFVEDGSYLRIQNVQLGYSLPVSVLEKTGIDKLRLYVAVNNLYTFTKYRGYNPDISNQDPLSAGVDLGQYPQTRSITTGVNLTF